MSNPRKAIIQAVVLGTVFVLAAAFFVVHQREERTRAPRVHRPAANVEKLTAPQTAATKVDVGAHAQPDTAGTSSRCDLGSPGLRKRRLGGWSLGGGRAVMSYVPKDFDRETAAIVIMTWGGDSVAEFLDYTEFALVADRENLVLLLPDPYFSFKSAWTSTRSLDGAWADLEAVQHAGCLEDADVFVLGELLGGRGADRLLCQTEHPVRAVATSGHIWRESRLEHWCDPQQVVPLLEITHVRFENGAPGCKRLVGAVRNQRLTARGCSRKRTRVDEWSFSQGECYSRDCESPLTTCEVRAGRYWPSATSVRRECDHPPATRDGFPYRRVIWEFFDKHRTR